MIGIEQWKMPRPPGVRPCPCSAMRTSSRHDFKTQLGKSPLRLDNSDRTIRPDVHSCPPQMSCPKEHRILNCLILQGILLEDFSLVWNLRTSAPPCSKRCTGLLPDLLARTQTGL